MEILDKKTIIRVAGPADVGSLNRVRPHGEGYYERCLADGRTVLVASPDGGDCGFAMMDFKPAYSLFKRLGIPEIVDLFVDPRSRQQGIATALLNACERVAFEKGCARIGLAVGLSSSAGAAQRLYIKCGYMPDGFGVTYDREPVAAMEIRPIDDKLCLMLVKDLR